MEQEINEISSISEEMFDKDVTFSFDEELSEAFINICNSKAYVKLCKRENETYYVSYVNEYGDSYRWIDEATNLMDCIKKIKSNLNDVSATN